MHFLHPGSWDAWIAFGFGGQALFFSRFAVQWVVSERAGQSTVPRAFWWLSLFGSLITLIYAVHRRDPVIVAGQALGWTVYARNLVLLYRRPGESPSG